MYGTCNTAANVAAKVVTCPAFTSLYEGATIRVKFTYGNSVDYEDGSTEIYATMNVNNTGAKSINLYGAAHVSSGLSGSWNPGSIITFTYNGTAWIANDYHDDRTVYATGSGLTTSYELTDAGVETRTFKHSNSVTAQTTQAVYPIKIDAQGHISAYGSAVSPLTSHQTIKQDGVTGATVNRFGTCATAAGTAAKTVSITTGTFSLEAGATVAVKFTNANTAGTPTLNVNSSGAKNIFHKGAQITTGNNKALLKGVVNFIYDGTQWHIVGADSTYTASTTSVGSASGWSAGSVPTLGTAIAADDITAWSAGSVPTLGDAIAADDITAWSAGTVPTLGTAIAADDITAWSAGTAASASVASGILTLTNGTAPSLSYTARSIPNVTSVGTAPSLSYTARSIPNVTSVGTAPSLSYTARSIPNVTSVGTAPSLTITSTTVANGVTQS